MTEDHPTLDVNRRECFLEVNHLKSEVYSEHIQMQNIRSFGFACEKRELKQA
jgi:hypothetical protein